MQSHVLTFTLKSKKREEKGVIEVVDEVPRSGHSYTGRVDCRISTRVKVSTCVVTKLDGNPLDLPTSPTGLGRSLESL